MRIRVIPLLSILAVLVSTTVPGSHAMRRTFKDASGSITFEGALERIDPFGLQGFVSQQGFDGPTAGTKGWHVSLRLWLGRPAETTADVTLPDGERVRRAHLFYWYPLPDETTTIVADGP